MFFRFRTLSAQTVGFEHVVLEDLQRFGHIGNFVRAAGRDLGAQVSRGNGFHAVLKTRETPCDTAAAIIPSDDKGGGKAGKCERNKNESSLPDLCFGFAHRGGGRRLAARSQRG